MTAKEIRAKSRLDMSGKWGKFVGMNVLYMAIFIAGIMLAFLPLAVSIVSSASNIIENGTNMSESDVALAAGGVLLSFVFFYIIYIAVIVLIVPLGYSLTKNIMDLKRKESTKATEFVKNWFKSFGRAWKVTLWIFVKMILYFILFYVAFFVIGILMGVFAAFGVEILSVILGIIAFIGMIVFYVILIARAISLSASVYIAIDNKELTAKDSVEKSIAIMKGYKWKWFCLNLSFIGWDILAMFTLGIGYIFLIPYMQVALVNFYENILKERGDDLPEMEETVIA